MREGQVLKSYSRALYKVADASQEGKGVYEDALLIRKIYASNSELRAFLRNRLIPSGVKYSLLVEVFNGLSSATGRFLKVLSETEHIAHLDSMLKCYIHLYHKEHKILEICVTVAEAPSNATKSYIENRIKEQLPEFELLFHYKIDKNILGGFILTFDSQRYDVSVLREVNLLKKTF